MLKEFSCFSLRNHMLPPFSSVSEKQKGLWQHLIVLLLFMFLQDVICSPSSSPSMTTLCSSDQSLALLHFKHAFLIDKTASSYCDGFEVSYPKTESWKESTDCCSWDGVTCDSLTGHVIGLDLRCSWLHGTLYPNSGPFLLHHLIKLNLAHNDFNHSQVSSEFGHLKRLTHLNLSTSNFYGLVPPEISYMSNLVSLDLSNNFHTLRLSGHNLRLDQHSFDKITTNLTDLKVLVLNTVDMSSIAPGSLLNLSSSLMSLHLSQTELQGKFPNDIFRFPFLQELNLLGNGPFIGHLPKSNWSSPLRFLDFSYTSFFGETVELEDRIHLPDAIGDLVYLNVLNLAYCHFKGSIPESLFNLTGLTSIDLTANAFSGSIPASISNLDKLTYLSLPGNNISGQLPPSIFNLTQLSHIDLSGNQLEGHFPSQVRGLPHLIQLDLSTNLLSGRIPSWLLALPSLQSLDLRYNQFTGPIDPFQQPGPVKHVSLANNAIHGPIPDSMFELVNLVKLDLSSNNLSGIAESQMFSKLVNLELVDFSYNRLLSLRSHSNVNFNLPNLTYFGCSSCNLNEFPIFLRNFRNLQTLDLSSNRIPGRISRWESGLWQNMVSLNLSLNFLTTFEQIPSMNLENLDLHSNLLQGPLVVPPPNANMIFFSVSHNKLTGEIPSTICNMSSLQYLVLANNSFSGMIPECLGNYEQLVVLDLSMNNFHGSIPQTLGNGSSLMTIINLNGNQLEGPLLTSLANCTSLEVLDVGNNMINGNFPHWLSTLPELQVLILRSNRFHGPIDNSMTAFPFPKLRILDISHNEFTGLLPTQLFRSFQAMMLGDNSTSGYMYLGEQHYQYYQVSVVLAVKGLVRTIERILTMLTAMDLSSNQFQGQIPKVIGDLNSLKVLNISHNSLTGQMPSSLGNLTQLESLDLSSNKLVQEIPIQLTSLTFLSTLNFSYNHLMGRIPQGNQFNTFGNNSYIGNLELCGPPLSKNCVNEEAPEPMQPDEEEDTWSWFDWKVIMMGYGTGIVIGLSMGYIVFSTGKPHWFVEIFHRDNRPRKVRNLSRSHQGKNINMFRL